MDYVVFDVDGCVADTEAAVREAYWRAGVTMPDSAWGKRASDWLLEEVFGDEALYRRTRDTKQAAYRELIAKGWVKPLPAAQVAHDLHDDGMKVRFITSGTEEVAREVLKTVGHDPELLIGGGLDGHGKVGMLRSLGSGVYVDDQPAGEIVAVTAGWGFVLCKNDIGRLTEDIREWTL